MRHFNWRYASVFAGFGAFVSLIGDADAARFQLRETSANKVGYACAGSAAEAGDISAQFDNPALMTTVDKSGAAGSLVMVAPNLKYNVNAATLQTATGGVPDPFRGGNDGDNSTPTALIPAAYLMWAVNDTVRLGLGITSPWGLQTDYNKNWSGSLFATRSKIESVDVNPSIAVKVNEKLSLGAGVSVQYAKAELGSALQRTNANLSVPELTVRGRNVGFGFNFGVLIKPWEKTRIGLSYRSAVRHKLKGHMDVSNRDNALLGNVGGFISPTAIGLVNGFGFINNLSVLAPNGTSVRAPMTLPEIFTFSAQHDFDCKWTGRFDAQWTRWQRLQSLNVDMDWAPNYAASAPATALRPVATGLQAFAKTSISESLAARDTWFFALGASYQYSDQTKLKFGIAHDRNAQKESSARLPDNNRLWLSVGVDQKFTDNLTASLDYSFIKVSTGDVELSRDGTATNARVAAAVAQINALAGGAVTAVNNTLGNQTFNARAKSYVNLLGVKFQYKF